jgi:hypothetical protein
MFNQKGAEINTLQEVTSCKLSDITIGCFYFSFGTIKEIEQTSILFKIQQYNDQQIFKPEEFVSFLRVRKIPFKLRWIPCHTWSLRKNLKLFLLIAKLNIQK